jgi:cytoskeletal protein RodZ
MDTEKITYNARREVVSDLFCADNDKVNRALHFICANPTPDYSKALCRLEKLATTIPRKILCLKSLCLCDPLTARKYLSATLKHQNPRLRAGGISLIPLLSPDLDNSGLLAYLLQSLSDKDKKVAAAALEALRKCIPKEKFNTILQNYFDPENEKSCFNSLFIMYKLETEFQPYIFESCLNHSSSKIQALARRLLPHFKKLHPELEKLLLRRSRQKNTDKTTQKTLPEKNNTETTTPENKRPQEIAPDTSSPFHEILKEILQSDDNRDKITILMEIRENENWFRDPFIYKTLQEHFQHESEPFVLATLVKTYARLTNQENNEWPVLQKYLEHEDKRVVANTVEAICHLKDRKILSWLESFTLDNDFSDKSNCRIISAGMEFLREESPSSALMVMHKLAEGGAPGTSTFIHHISQWENPPVELEQSVMELIGQETKTQNLYPLINHIARYGSLKAAIQIKQIHHKLPVGEKAELLEELLHRLYERFNKEEIEKAASTEKEPEIVVNNDLSSKIFSDMGVPENEKGREKTIFEEPEKEESINILEDWRIILLLFLTLLVFIFIIFVIYSGGKNPTQPKNSENYSTEQKTTAPSNTESPEEQTTSSNTESPKEQTTPSNTESPKEQTTPSNTESPKEQTTSSNTESPEEQTKTSTPENSEKQTAIQSTPAINIEKPKEPEPKTTPEKSAPVDFPRPPPVRTHHIAL